MSEYKINRWDVVLFGNSNTRVPMIYIKPDLTFINFIKENNSAVVCEISGTGTVYDGKKIPGMVYESSYIPSCRPNFFNKTGYYVITLWANWYGYPEPDKEGVVKFYGLKGSSTNNQKLSTIKNENKDENGPDTMSEFDISVRGMKVKNTFLTMGIVISLAVIIFLVLNKKK